MTTKRFQKIVWDYYAAHGRHELPWRLNLDPYVIVVSEVMLQQTQVERVIPKFEQWLATFPTWRALAAAPTFQVLTLWQGLGYNRRALALMRCAQVVVKDHGGELPRVPEKLLALPGIGPYTAGAIQAFAFNEPVVMIETNIRAVYLHHYYLDQKNISDDALRGVIAKTLDQKKPREWYWALMDYGGYLKKTYGNPARRSLHHTQQSEFEGSHRQVRGAIVRALTQHSSLSEKMLCRALQQKGIALTRFAPALKQLEREGFIARDGRRKKIALRR